jgi:hypothetical protein
MKHIHLPAVTPASGDGYCENEGRQSGVSAVAVGSSARHRWVFSHFLVSLQLIYAPPVQTIITNHVKAAMELKYMCVFSLVELAPSTSHGFALCL